MGVRHIVAQGDTLWELAGRYLGNNDMWPSIHDYHNRFVHRNGGVGRGLLFIENPDLIFIGQAVMVPGRKEERPPKPDPVKRTRRTKQAVPLDAEATYILHPDPVAPTDVTLEHPVKGVIQYGPFVTPDFTMSSELSGFITLKNMSPTRYQANWELALSDERNDLSYALRSQGHDAAFLELVAGMEMDFNPENGRATIKPSLAAKAGLGPYTLRLEMISPTRLSGSLKLDTISGEIVAHRRKFRFSADVTIKVDVTLHPKVRPVGPEPKPVRVPAVDKTRARFLPTKNEWVIGGTFVVGRGNSGFSKHVVGSSRRSDCRRYRCFWNQHRNTGHIEAQTRTATSRYRYQRPEIEVLTMNVMQKILLLIIGLPMLLQGCTATYTHEQIEEMFAPITSKYGIEIVYEIDEQFTPIWAGGGGAHAEYDKLEPIDKRVLAHYPKILEEALSKYPVHVVTKYLNAIYFAGKLVDRGIDHAGTTTISTEADYADGFMNTYSHTNFENDFNEYAKKIFTDPKEFKRIMHQYPRVRGKFCVFLDFYRMIDPIFTEAYLLGSESETLEACPEPGGGGARVYNVK